MYGVAILLKARWMLCVLLTAGLGRIHQLPGAASTPPTPQGSQIRTAELPWEAVQGDPHLAGRAVHQTRRVCRVTAYCDRGTTASGVRSGVGQCAAPADIPFGSMVYIPALDRTFVVTDRTAKRFRHNTVDIFIPTRKACRKFGRHYLECEFTIPAEPPTYGSPTLALAIEHVRS